MATPVPLGTANHFVILAGSGITIAGAVNSTILTGDIGTFPTTSVTGIGNAVLTGTNYSLNTPIMTQAKLDLVTAYLNAAGQGPAVTVPTELGGTAPVPGVYNTAAGTLGITGTLTLDAKGNPNAVWIFQAASTLITASASKVVLLNGAQACNVFFQVGSSATLGTSSTFVGNILALTSITVTTSATVSGSLLARNGAVTLDTNTCIDCTLAPNTSPSSLLAAGSCLSCMTETQLLGLLILALADHHLSGYVLPGDTNKLIKDSVCLTCLTDKQLEQVMIASLEAITESGVGIAALLKKLNCLSCANPKQKKAALVWLVTKIGLPA